MEITLSSKYQIVKNKCGLRLLQQRSNQHNISLFADWVIKLGPATYGSENQYQYAIVSDNVKATLFVLARDPEVFKRDYEAGVLQYLKEKGFTSIVNKPVKTYHESDCIYNDQHQ